MNGKPKKWYLRVEHFMTNPFYFTNNGDFISPEKFEDFVTKSINPNDFEQSHRKILLEYFKPWESSYFGPFDSIIEAKIFKAKMRNIIIKPKIEIYQNTVYLRTKYRHIEGEYKKTEKWLNKKSKIYPEFFI